MHLEMSSVKWRTFCLGLNELRAVIFNSSPPVAAYMSQVNGISIGSENGLSPIRCQAII